MGQFKMDSEEDFTDNCRYAEWLVTNCIRARDEIKAIWMKDEDETQRGTIWGLWQRNWHMSRDGWELSWSGGKSKHLLTLIHCCHLPHCHCCRVDTEALSLARTQLYQVCHWNQIGSDGMTLKPICKQGPFIATLNCRSIRRILTSLCR